MLEIIGEDVAVAFVTIDAEQPRMKDDGGRLLGAGRGEASLDDVLGIGNPGHTRNRKRCRQGKRIPQCREKAVLHQVLALLAE
ncbi:MAG: hypothetical protein OEY05_08975 [Paracoccaceae bacterium]|nr:hypothetical protein [Paracoccaceae bacterium]